MSNHFTNACPYLFGTPNRTKALYNYRRFVPVDRIPRFERNNIHRKLYALRHHFIVMESVLNFMMKNEDVI
jgi:cyclic nucleotide gated channel alpha 3